MSIIILIIGVSLTIAGAIQSPTFNGLDIVGWALLFAAVLTIAHRAAARRTR
jgi:uncharacterized membrane protein